MTGNVAEEPQDWAEANIVPASTKQPEALLLDVIDPLIRETLSRRIDSWHYFWEHDPIKMRHLRLRVLWRSGQRQDGMAVLTSHLDESKASGPLSDWFFGSQGVRGEQYEGEAAGYDGPAMWRVTYEDWRAGSELALNLLRLDRHDRLAEGRDFHLERRVHLHSNRLGLGYVEEGQLYLRLAIGYLSRAGMGANPDGARILATLSGINGAIAAAADRGRAMGR